MLRLTSVHLPCQEWPEFFEVGVPNSVWVCKGYASGDTKLFWDYSDCRDFCKHIAFPLSNTHLFSELFWLKVRSRMLKLPVFNSSSGFAEFKKDVKCSASHVIAAIISSLKDTIMGFMSVCNVSCLIVSCNCDTATVKQNIPEPVRLRKEKKHLAVKNKNRNFCGKILHTQTWKKHSFCKTYRWWLNL